MGTVLRFKTSVRRRIAAKENVTADCQIVIFPGVRIERHNLDLGHRLRDSVSHGDFDGLNNNNRRPRKTS